MLFHQKRRIANSLLFRLNRKQRKKVKELMNWLGSKEEFLDRLTNFCFPTVAYHTHFLPRKNKEVWSFLQSFFIGYIGYQCICLKELLRDDPYYFEDDPDCVEDDPYDLSNGFPADKVCYGNGTF